MKVISVISVLAGLVLCTLCARALNDVPEAFDSRSNPLAIRKSSYGKLLARLSQDTVDRNWHIGIEQVNAATHKHGPDCDHGNGICVEESREEGKTAAHDHDHEHEGEDARHHDHDHDHEAGGHAEHGHGDGHDPAGNAETHEHAHDHKIAEEGHKAGQEFEDPKPGGEGSEELAAEAFDVEAGHVHTEACAHLHGHEPEEGAEHDHDDDHHSPAAEGGGGNWLADAKDFFHELKVAKYQRTNPRAISERHRKSVAADIENKLLRAYNMDPTDYGVYNAYFLFLTANELRSTPAAREHARKVSNFTIGSAFEDNVDPNSWLTAAVAVQNLFFLDQQERWIAEKNTKLPRETIEQYRNQMGYCLQQFGVLKERAVAAGHWADVPVSRREQTEERARFATKTFAQFDAILARLDNPEAAPDLEGGADAERLTSREEDPAGAEPETGRAEPGRALED